MAADVIPFARELRAVLDSVPAAVRTDVLITELAAVGGAAYLLHLRRVRHHSALEARARWLVGVVTALCFVRGFTWLSPGDEALRVLEFLPAPLLPLTFTTFTEGLLRRHMRRWIKVLACVGSAAAFIVNLARPILGETVTRQLLGPGFGALLLVDMAALGAAMLRRDRRTLSRAENGLVETVIATTLVGLPLAATDFRHDLGWPANRMGGVAILLLLYTILRPARSRRPLQLWMRELAVLTAKAFLAATALIVLVDVPTVPEAVHWISAAMAVVLLLAVGDRLRELNASRQQSAVLDWLAAPAPASLAELERALRQLPLTADAALLGETDLGAYHTDAVRATFAGHGTVLSLAALRGQMQRHEGEMRGAEELVDLLVRTEATHAGLLSSNPLRLLLVAVPELAGAADAEREVAAVVRRGQHALANERVALGAEVGSPHVD